MQVSQRVEHHIETVARYYGPVLTGETTRLDGGTRLLRQFEEAACGYRTSGDVAAVVEKVNELAVAEVLLNDHTLAERLIQYEPKITADGRRIDFVVPDLRGCNVYIEVKTVHPRTENTEANWNKVQSRRKRHQLSADYIVEQERLGASLYGNSFAARSKFMDYTMEFESRLAATNEIVPGRGVLVFCGNGFAWSRLELEYFANFYETGRHRADDPFADMEAHALAEEQVELRRNISSFGYMKRGHDCITAEESTSAI